MIHKAAAAAAKSLQSCPTLCDPIDCSPPGSPIPGIVQARALEWVAISFSNAWKWKMKVKLLSRVRLLATPWTAAYQALLPMGFSRQEYWSGVPLPSPKLYIIIHKWMEENKPKSRQFLSLKNWRVSQLRIRSPLVWDLKSCVKQNYDIVPRTNVRQH